MGQYSLSSLSSHQPTSIVEHHLHVVSQPASGGDARSSSQHGEVHQRGCEAGAQETVVQIVGVHEGPVHDETTDAQRAVERRQGERLRFWLFFCFCFWGRGTVVADVAVAAACFAVARDWGGARWGHHDGNLCRRRRRGSSRAVAHRARARVLAPLAVFVFILYGDGGCLCVVCRVSCVASLSPRVYGSCSCFES